MLFLVKQAGLLWRACSHRNHRSETFLREGWNFPAGLRCARRRRESYLGEEIWGDGFGDESGYC